MSGNKALPATSDKRHTHHFSQSLLLTQKQNDYSYWLQTIVHALGIITLLYSALKLKI
jgi:hypothetical protein